MKIVTRATMSQFSSICLNVHSGVVLLTASLVQTGSAWNKLRPQTMTTTSFLLSSLITMIVTVTLT